MGACIAHHAKCFEGEMSSRSGLHRDLRPQAAGARHLACRIVYRGKRVKWTRPEVARSVSSFGGPARKVVCGNLRHRPGSAASQVSPTGATPPPESEKLLDVSGVSFGEHHLATLPRSADRFGPNTSTARQSMQRAEGLSRSAALAPVAGVRLPIQRCSFCEAFPG